MEYKDYYKIMGVAKDASQDEIKRAYRKLARKYHPDVSKEKDTEQRFKEVGEAYEVLKDPEKRAAYDRLGASWKAGQEGFRPPPDWNAGFEFHGGDSFGQNAGAEGFSDFFESLFGGGGRGGFRRRADARGRAERGEDSHAKVLIDLEDSYHGAAKSIVLHTAALTPDGHPHVKERTLNVKIPQGIKEGQSIRLQGQGSAGWQGGSAGDLYLEVGFNPHPLYAVTGADVSLTLPVSPWEAALGARIAVPTPAGKVELSVPPQSSSGKRMRLKGRGIPGNPPGDFYVTLAIVLPASIGEREKALYESLKQASSNFNPRAKLGV